MAERLGKTVHQLENEMPATELIEWRTIDQLEALERERKRMGQAAQRQAR